ncbi:MAG: tetratricopeptide repeat protein, partial [Holophagales bacterium]|nr:tetratricopeptide repeat protein [Holophagales bacterium]
RQAEADRRRAAVAFEAVGDVRYRAIALHHLGIDLFRQNRFAQAVGSFREALPLRRQAGDRRGEAITASSLAHAHQVRGEIQPALARYHLALELLDPKRDPAVRARGIHNLGVLYADLGERQRAERHLERAIEAWAEVGQDRARAASLNQLGRLHAEAGDPEAAAVRFAEALELRRKTGDRRGEAASLHRLGGTFQARGQPERALEHYRRARELLGEGRYPRSEAEGLLRTASLFESGPEGSAWRRPGESARLYGEALERFRRVGDPAGEAESRMGLARADAARGRLDAALESSSRALELFETLRARALEQRLRTSFYASIQGHFGTHVELLLELHRQRPGEGWSGRALLASERARARGLADLLSQAGAEGGEASGSIGRRRSLETELAYLEDRLLRLRDRPEPAPAGVLASAEAALDRLLEDLERTRADLRVRDPRIDRLLDPTAGVVGTLAELRSALQGSAPAGAPQAQMLIYWLGEERSYLFRLGADRPGGGGGELEVWTLPARSELEPRVRRAHGLLLRSHHRETRWASRAALCQLSHQLLGPVADRLGQEPLILVPDGALHYLPFAVLPDPRGMALGRDGAASADEACADAEPLLARHEVSYLPSASTLVRLQNRSRPEPEGLLAVVADPVFSASDPR